MIALVVFIATIYLIGGEVTLIHPVEGEVYFYEGNSPGATVALEYAVDFSSNNNSEEEKRTMDSCFEVFATDKKKNRSVPFPLRCYPFVQEERAEEPIFRTFLINNVLPGNYEVKLYTRKRNDGKEEVLRRKAVRNFTVSKDIGVPIITMNNLTTGTVGLNTDSSSIYIPYGTVHPEKSRQRIPDDKLKVCLEIELASNGSNEEKALAEKLGYEEVFLGEAPLKFCSDKVEDGLTLNNVKPSVPLYKLVVYAKAKDGNDEGERTTGYLQISRLEHVLPTIAITPDNRMLEWKLPPAKAGQAEADRTAGGPLQYRVFGLTSAVEQVVVCTELLLLQGGYTDFDLYATYGSNEEAIDEGIHRMVQRESAAHIRKLQGSPPAASIPVSEAGEAEGQGQEEEEEEEDYPLLFDQCSKAAAGKNASLYLEGLPAGVYLAKLYVAYNGSSDDASNESITYFLNRLQRITIAVQPGKEFVPGYEWRELRGWHSVPLGVESRLPVAALGYEEPSEEEIAATGMTDSGGDRMTMDDTLDMDSFDHKIDYDRNSVDFKTETETPEYHKTPAFYSKPGIRKTARIPNPWQIQIALPNPCKYFLRWNVYRDMSTADILRAATKQCRDLPEHCMNLVEDQDDGRDPILIDRDANVEVADLFNRKLRLELKEDRKECVPE